MLLFVRLKNYIYEICLSKHMNTWTGNKNFIAESYYGYGFCVSQRQIFLSQKKKKASSGNNGKTPKIPTPEQFERYIYFP